MIPAAEEPGRIDVPTDGWAPDLLAGFVRRDLPLAGVELHPSEPSDPLVATLVRRAGTPTRDRAVLYIHGWNDYFFQTHLADFFEAQGYDFYAIDLRRYGRSLRPGQLQGWVTRLEDYAVELDAAYAVIADEGHDTLLLHGHSTGGLVAAIYAADRPGLLSALILNAPFLHLRSSRLRQIVLPGLVALGARYPGRAVSRGTGMGIYAQSIWSGAHGRWDYDLSYKSTAYGATRLGWLRAVRAAQARVVGGLEIDCPVVSFASSRSLLLDTYDERARAVDTVLDTDEISRRAALLGPCVTIVRIDGGMHDLALSDEGPLADYLDRLGRWLRAALD